MLPPDEVRSSIARRLNIDIGGLIPTDRSVDGVVDMLLTATQAYDRPLSKDRLLGWQMALFPAGRSGSYTIQTGRWPSDDTGLIQVVPGPLGRERVRFDAPASERLADEMTRFIDWFNTEQYLDPMLKSAIAHLWFVTIHPFDDGNGRIARAITDMQLARAERSRFRYLQYVSADSIRPRSLLHNAGTDAARLAGHHRLAGLVSGLPTPAPESDRTAIGTSADKSALLVPVRRHTAQRPATTAWQ